MRIAIIGALLALAPAVAAAQYFKPLAPPPPPSNTLGGTTYSYDRQSGNRYTTTTQPDGSATVRGSNLQSGSRWRTEVQPDGSMRGRDSNGDTWRYNSQSGRYTNSNGTTCSGSGNNRRCY